LIPALTEFLAVSTTETPLEEKPSRMHPYLRVGAVQESAALALRVGELHQRNELLCRERDAKCLITDLYNVLELKEGRERKPNFAEGALSGQPLAVREILEEKEFKPVRIVALGQTSNTPTIGTSTAK